MSYYFRIKNVNDIQIAKSSAKGCCLAFTWRFTNFSLVLLMKVLFIKRSVCNQVSPILLHQHLPLNMQRNLCNLNELYLDWFEQILFTMSNPHRYPKCLSVSWISNIWMSWLFQLLSVSQGYILVHWFELK